MSKPIDDVIAAGAKHKMRCDFCQNNEATPRRYGCSFGIKQFTNERDCVHDEPCYPVDWKRCNNNPDNTIPEHIPEKPEKPGQK